MDEKYNMGTTNSEDRRNMLLACVNTLQELEDLDTEAERAILEVREQINEFFDRDWADAARISIMEIESNIGELQMQLGLLPTEGTKLEVLPDVVLWANSGEGPYYLSTERSNEGNDERSGASSVMVNLEHGMVVGNTYRYINSWSPIEVKCHVDDDFAIAGPNADIGAEASNELLRDSFTWEGKRAFPEDGNEEPT